MENLDLVRKRFPELKDRIDRRYRDDAVFREVCEDYAEVWTARASLPHTENEPEDYLGQEYENLLQELEAEILTSL
jgi:hypothetical protein